MVEHVLPRPAVVDVAEVTRAPLVVTLDEEGETRVRERFVVSAPVAGTLLRIELEPGDAVHQGETVLAVLQPRESTLLDARSRAEAEEGVKALEAELERAKHGREAARAERDFAKVELERARLHLAADRPGSARRVALVVLSRSHSKVETEAAQRILDELEAR